MEKKLTILVTGASGFLGKAILKAFSHTENIHLIAACRNKNKLPSSFSGEVRQGDLQDSAYLKTMVKDVDIICHAGTWAAMWGHRKQEKQKFYQPNIELIEYAIAAGVKRFLMTSTVVVANKTGQTLDDFAPTNKTGFWPHLDYLIDIDNYMKTNAHRGMQMTTMRLGHFVGAGNTLGLIPVLVPRLKTFMVPWLKSGTSRLPLTADSDLGRSFVKASFANELQNYESFNICGSKFPTMREVIEYISEKTGLAKPFFSVPYPIEYVFAWTMEKIFPLMPGKAPFLTRSIVHLAEEWVCSTEYASKKLNYQAKKDWHVAIDEALAELKEHDYPWPYLAQI